MSKVANCKTGVAVVSKASFTLLRRNMTHQLFFVHTEPEEFKGATSAGHFRFELSLLS